MYQTQTVDIEHVTRILKNCPHYDEIVNYEYKEGDTLSSMLIDWYRDLIFSIDGTDERQLKIVMALDKSLYLYVKDKKYKKGLMKLMTTDEITLHDSSLIKEVIKKIIIFTNSYEKKEIFEVSNSKWL